MFFMIIRPFSWVRANMQQRAEVISCRSLQNPDLQTLQERAHHSVRLRGLELVPVLEPLEPL
jgi:hypothetical protein